MSMHERAPGHPERPPNIMLGRKDGKFIARLTAEDDPTNEIFEALSPEEAIGKLVLKYRNRFPSIDHIIVTQDDPLFFASATDEIDAHVSHVARTMAGAMGRVILYSDSEVLDVPYVLEEGTEKWTDHR